MIRIVLKLKTLKTNKKPMNYNNFITSIPKFELLNIFSAKKLIKFFNFMSHFLILLPLAGLN